MCGIFFSARLVEQEEDASSETQAGFQMLTRRLKEANTARGPDAQNTYTTYIQSDRPRRNDSKVSSVHHTSEKRLLLDFFASELRLRGNTPVVQPHVHNDDILCWNGEIFEGMDILAYENDGAKFFKSILALEQLERLPQLFGSIEGPYAFVFYHSASKRLIFARDPLGRRSLLIHKPTRQQPYFLLTSVSVGSNSGYDLNELSTGSIYSLDLGRLSNMQDHLMTGFESCITTLNRVADPDLCILPYAVPRKINRMIPPGDFAQPQSLDQIPEPLCQAVDDLIYYLDRSVMLRVRDIPHISNLGQARVAVLFSGGIDSTVLAFFAHRHLPIDEPIDLLNVAFENPRKIQVQSEGNIQALNKKQKKAKMREMGSVRPESTNNLSYRVPDRVTGLQEVEELRQLCPGRMWNFVEVDVPYDESQAARPVVEGIMFPGRTVMDLSLAMALYFASRGIGHIRRSPEAHAESYISTARVLLNGLGSDELLGGYGRHRTAFNLGWQAVIDELQLEIERIPTRNLGRDDRVIASHGKETRHPFLSLSVVSFLADLPVHFKLDPRLELGLGDKMLLRLAARKVGLTEASQRKKRAMQFGSHSARMEVGGNERRGDLWLSSPMVET